MSKGKTFSIGAKNFQFIMVAQEFSVGASRFASSRYEVRSETKLVFRLVESLFRFVSLSTEFVASTFQIELKP